jgi:hypothetical protein
MNFFSLFSQNIHNNEIKLNFMLHQNILVFKSVTEKILFDSQITLHCFYNLKDVKYLQVLSTQQKFFFSNFLLLDSQKINQASIIYSGHKSDYP